MSLALPRSGSLPAVGHLRLWGSKDTDRIHICLNDQLRCIKKVSFLFGLSRPFAQFARASSALAQHARCVFGAWPHFEPFSERTMAEIARSEAARFVRAPREHFEELHRDQNKEARGWTRQ